MEEKTNIWTQLGYYGVIFVILILFMSLCYPLTEQMKPFLSNIFPLNPNNNIWKLLIIVSIVYWGIATAFMINASKKS